VSSLVVKWNDATADRIAAVNLFLDHDKAHRKADLEALRAQVGACQPGSGFDRVENALRGDWTMACERGRVRIAVTLAPTMPPKVQALTVATVSPGADLIPQPTCPTTVR